MICETCGETLHIGDWPYCPHGSSNHAIQTNESFIGGVTLENLGHDSVTVHSREEFKAAMKAANVEQRIHHVPGDKYLTNWDVPSAYTLECAKILLSRGQTPPVDEAALPSLTLKVYDVAKERRRGTLLE